MVSMTWICSLVSQQSESESFSAWFMGAWALWWERGMPLGCNSFAHYILWAEHRGVLQQLRMRREGFIQSGPKQGSTQRWTSVFRGGDGAVGTGPRGNGSIAVRPHINCDWTVKEMLQRVEYLRIVLLQYYSTELFPLLTWNSFAAIFECGFDMWVGCISELVSYFAPGSGTCQPDYSDLDSV